MPKDFFNQKKSDLINFFDRYLPVLSQCAKYTDIQTLSPSYTKTQVQKHISYFKIK